MTHEDAPRPSRRAAARLAGDVRSEVGDLRSSLHAALDEATRLEAVGDPGRALEVLERQRDELAALHRRLEERLAGAAVEREAEQVVAAAVVDEVPVGAGQVVTAIPVEGGDGTALRLLVSAAAAVVGAVLLLGPDVGGGVLQVAGWGEVDEVGDDAAAGDAMGPTDAPTAAPAPSVLPEELQPSGTPATVVRPSPASASVGSAATADDTVGEDGQPTVLDAVTGLVEEVAEAAEESGPPPPPTAVPAERSTEDEAAPSDEPTAADPGSDEGTGSDPGTTGDGDGDDQPDAADGDRGSRPSEEQASSGGQASVGTTVQGAAPQQPGVG